MRINKKNVKKGAFAAPNVIAVKPKKEGQEKA